MSVDLYGPFLRIDPGTVGSFFELFETMCSLATGEWPATFHDGWFPGELLSDEIETVDICDMLAASEEENG